MKTSAVYADRQRRTCVAVERASGKVTFIRLSVELGIELSTATTKDFDEEFSKLLVDYPAERAARLYVSYARMIGASEEALAALGSLTTVTPEDIAMATAKKKARTANPGPKPAAKGKSPAKPKVAATHQPEAKAVTKTVKKAKTEKAETHGERKPSAATRFQELIREGKLTDDQIFAKVQGEFGLDDKKRSYVGWYRNYMRKNGETVPDAK